MKNKDNLSSPPSKKKSTPATVTPTTTPPPKPTTFYFNHNYYAILPHYPIETYKQIIEMKVTEIERSKTRLFRRLNRRVYYYRTKSTSGRTEYHPVPLGIQSRV